MFNLGFSEILLISVVALIFIGPKQLPQIARVIGRVMGEFRKATADINRSFYDVQNKAQTAFLDMENNIQDNLKMDELDKKTNSEEESKENKAPKV